MVKEARELVFKGTRAGQGTRGERGHVTTRRDGRYSGSQARVCKFLHAVSSALATLVQPR